MSNYTLQRQNLGTNGPTFGELTAPDGTPLCVTLERPWQDNKPDVSCIPPGTYTCVPHDTVSKPHCWELTGVPDRSSVLIHVGNTIADTEGCILVGIEKLGENAIGGSVAALDFLRGALPDTFNLTINNPTGDQNDTANIT